MQKQRLGIEDHIKHVENAMMFSDTPQHILYDVAEDLGDLPRSIPIPERVAYSEKVRNGNIEKLAEIVGAVDPESLYHFHRKKYLREVWDARLKP